jgi:hypothetical protein
MIALILLLQKVNIEEKIKNAPNDGYQIGILIGSYLPFIILVLLAYWTYHRAKNRKE